MRPPGRGVAVFGSSEPIEGDPVYELGRQVGRLLAREGLVVITGGYGGVMEAASRGAIEEGGVTLGITARVLTPLRAGPNPYLTSHIEEEGLFERTRELISRSAGYIILPGKAGTLAELTFLWALNKARLLNGRPVVLLGASWRRFLQQVTALDLVDLSEIEITHVAGTPEEAVGLILSAMR